MRLETFFTIRIRKLHSIKMEEGESVQEYIRQMTEVFSELSAMDAPKINNLSAYKPT